MSLTPPDEGCNVDVAMEELLDQAARRTAANLMRLNRTLDVADALEYSTELTANGETKREGRLRQLGIYYRRWFSKVAGPASKGSPTKGTVSSGSEVGAGSAAKEET